MRFSIQVRFLLALSCALVLFTGNNNPANAQKFLEPRVSQPPPLDVVVIPEPVYRVASAQRAPSLAAATTGLTSLSSVNMASIPSGQYSYGFAKPATSSLSFDVGSVPVNVSFNPGTLGFGKAGFYGGCALPVTATSSVELNTVDCPFLREGRSTAGIGLDPIRAGGAVQIKIGDGWRVGVSGWEMENNPEDVSLSSLNAFFGN